MRKCQALLFCTLLIGWFLPAKASDNPNLLVMGMDADRGAIARDSRVFRRVLDALNNQLHDMGFNVYDETTITLDNFVQGRSGRSDAELIDIARSVQRPPIDIMVLFTIYSQAEAQGYTTAVNSRIEGRLLNVKSGQRLGNFEVSSPAPWQTSASCNTPCRFEREGDYAKSLATDLGQVLGEKLAWQVNGGQHPSTESQLVVAYNLVFDGFSPVEVMAIEEYLVIFSGYQDHRPVYASQSRTELWYQSQIKTAKLHRNLQKMLTQLDLRGLVQFSGNTYNISKITLPGQKRLPVAGEW